MEGIIQTKSTGCLFLNEPKVGDLIVIGEDYRMKILDVVGKDYVVVLII